jgi:hypothetical protein
MEGSIGKQLATLYFPLSKMGGGLGVYHDPDA